MAQGFYGGYMGNAGALSDLVYRGEPTQMMPMPYYGGGGNVQQLAQGIPVGQDPLLPMDQDQFRDWVLYNMDKNNPLPKKPAPTGPQLPSFLNRGVRGASIPDGFDGKYVSWTASI